MKKNAELQKKTVLGQMHMKKIKIQAGHMIMNNIHVMHAVEQLEKILLKIVQ